MNVVMLKHSVASSGRQSDSHLEHHGSDTWHHRRRSGPDWEPQRWYVMLGFSIIYAVLTQNCAAWVSVGNVCETRASALIDNCYVGHGRF